MTHDELVAHLLSVWIDRRAQGEPPVLEELCSDHPELLSELQRRVQALGTAEGAVSSSTVRSDAQLKTVPPPPGNEMPPPAALSVRDPYATRDDSPEDAALPLLFPQLPGYQIERELGCGGMGVVYLATDVRLRRRVAVKMVRAGGHAGRDELARFQREAEAVARLQHPNIVQIHEVGAHGGLPFFVLEYCPGGSVDNKLGGTPLPPPEAASLVEMLARAVQAAHDKGVIHRDLKPHNVLLAEDGTPKVADFGLAKKMDEAGQTHTGAVVGTPSYMAPEQARGQGRDIGPAVDVYALGAILYECLTGRPPFKAATVMDTLRQVENDEPVSPRQLNDQVARDLETVCLKCLEKSPERRYASAAELARDLERYLNGEPVRARPARGWERAWKWAKRRPALASLFAVVVLATLGLLGGGLWFTAELAEQRNEALQARDDADEARKDAERARDEARQRAEKEKELRQGVEQAKTKTEWLLYASQIALAQREWQDGEVEHARDLLDSCRRDFRGWEHAYLRHLFNETQQTLLGHTKAVYSVCFTPNGRRLASASEDDTVKLWDAQTGQEVLTLKGHTHWVHSVCFSPDDKRLASASDDQTVKVWDAQTGREVLTLKGHTSAVTSVAFSPDGKRIASASQDQTVKLWDAQTGQEVLTLKGHTSAVTSVTFSPDGKRIASASQDQTVKLWDAQTGQEVLTLKGHTHWVHSVCFSPDGKRLASADGEWTKPGEVKVWDGQTGQEVLTLHGHTTAVYSVCFSPDGRRLASASWGKTVKLWDAQTGQEVLTLKGHTDPVYSVAFSPDGRRLASASYDHTVKVWDAQMGQEALTLKGQSGGDSHVCFSPDGKRLAGAYGEWTKPGEMKVRDVSTGQVMLTLKGHTREVTSVVYSPDGKRLASASDDQTVKVWDAQTGREVLTLKGHSERVYSVAFSPDGKRLASSSGEWNKPGVVKMWDAQTGQEVLTLKGHANAVYSVCFSPDGRRLASASWDKTVKLWDAQTGREVLTLKGHSERVYSVAFSPDGKRLASASIDQTVKMWNAEIGQEVLTLKGHANAVYSVCFSPDGRRLASASWDKTVKLWDAQTGQEVLTLKGHTFGLTSVCFSPDGKWLASSSKDWIKPGEVKLWDASTGQDVLTLKGHTANVNSVCFSPDDRRLASASQDQTVKVWDTQTGQEMLTLEGHTGTVDSVCFSPDGRRLASASWDKTVKLWDAQTGQEVLTLKGHSERVYSVAFSPDGKRLITAEKPPDRGAGTLHAWDAATGREILPCADAPLPEGQLRAATSDGRLCAIAAGPRVLLHRNSPLDARQRAERQELERGKQRLWHQQRAKEAEERRQWFAAAFHLQQLLRLEPGNANLYGRLGWARAEQEQWDQAVANFARASELEPRQAWWMYFQGVALLGQQGELERRTAPARCLAALAVPSLARPLLAAQSLQSGLHEAGSFRTHCRTLLQRFGQTHDLATADTVAWLVVLRPDAVADWKPVLRIVGLAVKSKPDNAVYLETAVAALYRAGRYAEGHKSLQEAIRKQGKGGSVWQQLFLAMTEHRLGHPIEAKHWLTRAIKQMEAAPPASWEDRVAWWLLRQEAEALLKRSQP